MPPRIPACTFLLLLAAVFNRTVDAQPDDRFNRTVQPLLAKLCVRCHNADKMTSGIRLDHLTGEFADNRLFLWKDIANQIADEAMPPEDEPQPTADERQQLVTWIRHSLDVARSRDREKNGSVRRLTIAQYRNTLRDLLGLEDDLTDILPPDSVSKDGFVNNSRTMLLSPLLIDAYFEVAEKALDRCLVDETRRPVIQTFRVDLGNSINTKPCPDNLILGANSHLLRNQDFVVTQPRPPKPFEYDPFVMRTKYEFNEGYQGNATVRGWRKYDSIYHAVFACVRGTQGYPKGFAFQPIENGLLLRPAIPSSEIFRQSSTYGPRANFKISLRELPDQGPFRVTVEAARYDDGLLLDSGSARQPEDDSTRTVIARNTAEPQTVRIERAGVYQADIYLTASRSVPPDDSKLNDELVGAWPFDGNAASDGTRPLTGKLTRGARFVDSPFGEQAVLFDGEQGAVVVPRDESMNVGDGEFTVAAWIHPRGLRQAGIVSLGGYGYTHGWLLDMPAGNGVLRMETADANNQSNGTVQSAAGTISNNRWQHVAAVVRRGEKKTRLYVNGFEVAVGTIKPANLDNPQAALHIGRIPEANLFKGEIDEVRFYRRALGVAEIKALVAPGSQFVQPPPAEKRKPLYLQLSDRQLAGTRLQEAFAVVRLAAGSLRVSTKYLGNAAVDRVVFTRLDDQDETARRFAAFERRSPQLGVHVGLRRDCGSTLARVGQARKVDATEVAEFVFTGAISNFPSPDVEKNNINYLAGIREIGVRSEFTDGRDMPRLLVKSVQFEGPFYETWPPKSHRNIFIPSKHRDDPPAYARDIIRSFATRAFRRPVTDVELNSLMTTWEESFEDRGDFRRSVQDALLVVLTSPQFLFLIERSENPAAEPLDDYELASKLSYFLWNTSPDRELLELAVAGKLRESLDEQIDRMVRDGRFHQFAREFASQWLSLHKVDTVEVDPQRFPRLTRDTKTQLRSEPVYFVQHLLRRNLPIRHLVQSEFIVANEVVASYYDLGDRVESGFEFVPVSHGNANLGGLLTQAGILAALSDGRESNPIKRGAWLARKIIAEPPDDPPPNVPELDEDLSHLTLRERLERHRNQQGCAGCHAGIDPWGIPFEHFSAGGLFKSDDKVDGRSELPDGTRIADFTELRRYLATDRIDQVAFSFLKHVTTYAIGRSLTYPELESLRDDSRRLRADGHRAQDLLRHVIHSEAFLTK